MHGGFGRGVVITGACLAVLAFGVLSSAAAPPVNVTNYPPQIGGDTTAAGNELTVSTGTWTGSPTSFTYQWQRCDVNGQNCADIEGANASTYTTTAADVGAYARTYDLGYTIAADLTGDVLNLYGVFALPTQVFIDPNGVIRAVVNGPLTQAQATAYVAAILPPAGSVSPSAP